MGMEKSTNFLELLKQQRFIASSFSFTCLTHSTKGSEHVGVLGFDDKQVQSTDLPYSLYCLQF